MELFHLLQQNLPTSVIANLEKIKTTLMLAALLIAAASWSLAFWLRRQPTSHTPAILDKFPTESKRFEALQSLQGNEALITLKGKSRLEWARMDFRRRGWIVLLVAYLATLGSAVLIVAMVFFSPSSPATSVAMGSLADSLRFEPEFNREKLWFVLSVENPAGLPVNINQIGIRTRLVEGSADCLADRGMSANSADYNAPLSLRKPEDTVRHFRRIPVPSGKTEVVTLGIMPDSVGGCPLWVAEVGAWLRLSDGRFLSTPGYRIAKTDVEAYLRRPPDRADILASLKSQVPEARLSGCLLAPRAGLPRADVFAWLPQGIVDSTRPVRRCAYSLAERFAWNDPGSLCEARLRFLTENLGQADSASSDEIHQLIALLGKSQKVESIPAILETLIHPSLVPDRERTVQALLDMKDARVRTEARAWLQSHPAHLLWRATPGVQAVGEALATFLIRFQDPPSAALLGSLIASGPPRLAVSLCDEVGKHRDEASRDTFWPALFKSCGNKTRIPAVAGG